MLKSKCILAPKDIDDGKRISIMSRHTLNDGHSPDPRITTDCFDIHRPELGPSAKLVGKHYRQEIDFNSYSAEYKHSLKEKSDVIEAIIQEALVNNITVMCIEEDPTFCHRKIFIETAQELANTLGISIDIHIE